jgi:hypothetical protein
VKSLASSSTRLAKPWNAIFCASAALVVGCGIVVGATATASAQSGSSFITYKQNGDALASYSCVRNTNYDSPRVPIYDYKNNCDFRVWLHEFVDYEGNGWAYCTNGITGRGSLPADRRNPENIQITSNENPC